MKLILSAFTALLCLTAAVRAQGPSPVEQKLRETLKTVQQRMTTAEAEVAKLRAEKTALETKNKELEENVKQMGGKLENLTGEMAETKKTAAATEADLKGRLTRTEDDLKLHKLSLDKWQAAHAQIAAVARKKEGERANAADRGAALERRVSDLRSRNGELYKTGIEILERYRKFGLGEALAAREPFTGITRVKMENLVQEYKDKLLDGTADAKPRPAPQPPPNSGSAPPAPDSKVMLVPAPGNERAGSAQPPNPNQPAKQ